MKWKEKATISKLSLEMVEHCNCGHSLVLPCEIYWTSLMRRFQQQKPARVSFAGTHLCPARCSRRCCKNCSHNVVVTMPSLQLFPEFPLQLYFSVALHNSKTQHLLQTAVLFQALQLFWDRNYQEWATAEQHNCPAVRSKYKWKHLPATEMTVINKTGHQSSRKKKKNTEFFLYTARTLEPSYVKK